jgi:2-polyprenyl-3-methyl-5-hydroxy-6-metoxy-1,4-benzoquinol methylase
LWQISIMRCCPVCGSLSRPIYRLLRHDRTALRCFRCGLTWLDRPHFTVAEQSAYYASSVATQAAAVDPVGSAPEHFANVSPVIARYCPPRSRVLEIGCGAGDLLQILKQNGFDAMGIEPSDAGSTEAHRRGLSVFRGTVEDADLTESAFHAVISTHVIEHVADLHAFVDATRRFLSPGGIQIVVTPNGEAPLYRALGRFWTYATPDEHNYICTAKSLRLLGRAHGFSMVSAGTTGRYCGILTGAVREVFMTRRRHGTAPRVALESAAARRSGQRAIATLELLESPLLSAMNRMLRRFGRGDELLVVLIYDPEQEQPLRP